MGKKLIRASHHSWKTALLLYTKVVTFIFALFCVASGQVLKASNSDTGGITFRGRALSPSDSTFFSNTTILLADIFAPLYGSGGGAFVESVYDSTYSDEYGYFELTFDTSSTPLWLQVVAERVDESGQKNIYHSLDLRLNDHNDEDSVYTYYLYPISTSVKRNETNIPSKQLQITQGRKININFSEWSGDELSAITVIDLKGNAIAKLQPRPEGIVTWDTRGVARGVYFIRLRNNVGDINMRLLIK